MPSVTPRPIPRKPYDIWRIRAIFDAYGVESHYDRLAQIDRLQIANHAGNGSWAHDPRLTNAMNRYSIGIELLGIGTRAEMKDVLGSMANLQVKSGDRGYTEEQYMALEQLIRHLRNRYGLPPENIISHQAYDPGRKWDPGVLLDWSRVR
mgnify:CR=1 FL=1